MGIIIDVFYMWSEIDRIGESEKETRIGTQKILIELWEEKIRQRSFFLLFNWNKTIKHLKRVCVEKTGTIKYVIMHKHVDSSLSTCNFPHIYFFVSKDIFI